MKKYLSFLVGLYAFVLSWTSAFKFVQWVPPHVFIGVICILFFLAYIIVNQKVSISVYKKEDYLILFFLIMYVISSVINNNGINSLTYVLAYLYVFGGYIILKGAFYNSISLKKIDKWILLGVLVASTVSILEFVASYKYGLDIGGYLYRSREIPATYLGLERSAAFSTEPGILAFYLETVGVIAISAVFLKAWSMLFKFIIVSLITIGWSLTFSAGSFASLLIGSFCSFIIWLSSTRSPKISRLFTSLGVVVLVSILVFEYKDTYLSTIIDKITLQADTARPKLWMSSLNSFAEDPFLGKGPGYYASLENTGWGSPISWYLMILEESGLFTFIALFLFLISKLIRLLRLKSRRKYLFIAAFLAGTAHLSVISTFHHPFLWFSVIYFDIVCTLKKS